ncbi:hypothetical protein [Streptomyces sp. NPDC001348]
MVGLFTYIAVVRRAPVVFALTGGSMVCESVAVPNLAGREHLVAVGAAIVLGLLHPRERTLPRPRPAGPPVTAHPASGAGLSRR